MKLTRVVGGERLTGLCSYIVEGRASADGHADPSSHLIYAHNDPLIDGKMGHWHLVIDRRFMSSNKTFKRPKEMAEQKKMSHHVCQAIGMEIMGLAKDPNSWQDNKRCPITIARLSDVNFNPPPSPEREIAIQLYKISRVTSKMRIQTTLKINRSRSPATDTTVTPSFNESRKKAGGKWGGFFSRLMCRQQHTTVVLSLDFGLSTWVKGWITGLKVWS